MKKKIPIFKTDEEAERFVETADLSEYDFSQFKPVRFEFEKKAARVNMRLPEALLNAVKQRAEARGIPYQRFIREAQTANSIRSRHIVETFDFGQLSSGSFFVVMELGAFATVIALRPAGAGAAAGVRGVISPSPAGGRGLG